MLLGESPVSLHVKHEVPSIDTLYHKKQSVRGKGEHCESVIVDTTQQELAIHVSAVKYRVYLYYYNEHDNLEHFSFKITSL